MLDAAARLDNHQTPALHARYDDSRHAFTFPPLALKGSMESLMAVMNFSGAPVASNVGRVLDESSEPVTSASCSTSTECETGIGVSHTDIFGILLREHRNYLHGLVKQGLISPALEDNAMTSWWRLSNAVEGNLAVPDAAPGSDGELLFIWKRGNHYLSLEMSKEGADFFYRDRSTGVIWGTDYDLKAESVPDEIVAKLRLFPGDR